ncbi:helix-turn-helix transcriptional regulator [Streptomyces sp. NPDC032472]|uniref:helix-turn-helix transcriptional regulator n=1 Tax=Streptomyces sp. NPDC032472 TaxID=3155018 RepID=UPI0033C5C93B
MSSDIPAGRFASELRELQRQAMASAGSLEAMRALSAERVAAGREWPTSRSAIYAALNGTSLPSVETLCAMVAAWAPRRAADIATWLRRRDEVQDESIAWRAATAQRPAQPGKGRPFSEVDAVESPVILVAEAKRSLREALIAKNMTVSELAAESGLGRTTVYQALDPSGAVPSRRTIIKLAGPLGMEAMDLFNLLLSDL